MTGRSGPAAFFETLSGGTRPSPIFFAGALGGQNQRQLLENMFLGDETIAIFFVRVPAERRERKVLSDVRQA